MKDARPPEEPDPKAFDRLKDMTKRLLAVPKREVDKATARKAAKKRRKSW